MGESGGRSIGGRLKRLCRALVLCKVEGRERLSNVSKRARQPNVERAQRPFQGLLRQTIDPGSALSKS